MLVVSMKLAPAWSPCSTVMKRRRAWSTRLSTRHRETASRCWRPGLDCGQQCARSDVAEGCVEAYGATRTEGVGSSFWKAWSVFDRSMEQAVNWADVKASVVVKQVAPPVPSDPWDIDEASLMLTDFDGGAQRSFFRTFDFDRCGNKQFGPAFDGIGLV